jgi:hypothetical protein
MLSKDSRSARWSPVCPRPRCVENPWIPGPSQVSKLGCPGNRNCPGRRVHPGTRCVDPDLLGLSHALRSWLSVMITKNNKRQRTLTVRGKITTRSTRNNKRDAQNKNRGGEKIETERERQRKREPDEGREREGESTSQKEEETQIEHRQQEKRASACSPSPLQSNPGS